jgi:hypothetical protein
MTIRVHSDTPDTDRCPRCGQIWGEPPTAQEESNVSKLKAALEPFTKLGGPDDGVMPAYHDLEDDVVIWKDSTGNITAGEIRAARNAFGLLHAPQRAKP